ncbi:hypothetical protein BofuT4_P055020.1 [Botrytis cinerea T4]|uniref:Uncharacterized protein n=1 Tax=Botryotinia fuckeliana (strain T4) TaxID=999810 RepID=G2XVT1_BOTF4|nr:hypothetical protein BofuT4_P055020.1 [Botrytis cinerea T4]
MYVCTYVCMYNTLVTKTHIVPTNQPQPTRSPNYRVKVNPPPQRKNLGISADEENESISIDGVSRRLHKNERRTLIVEDEDAEGARKLSRNSRLPPRRYSQKTRVAL